jgi:cellulose biosynthesis protein BcsQ
MNPNYIINPYDDTYIDSRSLRRQMKRLRKLQERERDKIYNQNLIMAYKLNKKENKKNIETDIKEQIEIFELE